METRKTYLKGVTALHPSWLLNLAPALCKVSKPLESPLPKYPSLQHAHAFSITRAIEQIFFSPLHVTCLSVCFLKPVSEECRDGYAITLLTPPP